MKNETLRLENNFFEKETCHWLSDEGRMMMGMVPGIQIMMVEKSVTPVIDVLCWAHVQEKKNDKTRAIIKRKILKTRKKRMDGRRNKRVKDNEIVPEEGSKMLFKYFRY